MLEFSLFCIDEEGLRKLGEEFLLSMLEFFNSGLDNVLSSEHWFKWLGLFLWRWLHGVSTWEDDSELGLLFRSLFDGLDDLLLFAVTIFWLPVMGVDADVGVIGEKKLVIDLTAGLLGVWLSKTGDLLTGILETVVELWAVTLGGTGGLSFFGPKDGVEKQ